jgi:hypothetical protein
MQSIPFGTAQDLNFDFHNFSNEPITITYTLEAMFTTVNEGGSQDQEIISLNGMEAGTNVTDQLVIPAGKVAAIPVNVEFVQEFLRRSRSSRVSRGSLTESAGDIILSVDVDQDGEIDAATSISVRPVTSQTPTPTPTPTPTITNNNLYLPLIMRQSQ